MGTTGSTAARELGRGDDHVPPHSPIRAGRRGGRSRQGGRRGKKLQSAKGHVADGTSKAAEPDDGDPVEGKYPPLLHGGKGRMVKKKRPRAEMRATAREERLALKVNPALALISRKATLREHRLDCARLKLKAFPPTALTTLSQVQHIDMSHNKLKKLPASISTLHHLHTLSCHDNLLEALPRTLGNLPALTHLDCSYNAVAELPATFTLLVSLQEARCCHNQLTELPEGLGAMTRLRRLDLGHNKIKRLPPSTTRLVALNDLTATHNRIHNLPRKFAQIPNLAKLDLSNNGLKELPEEFGELTSLEVLFLNHNSLAHLPPSFIADMPRLRNIVLHHNKFRRLGEWTGDVRLQHRGRLQPKRGTIFDMELLSDERSLRHYKRRNIVRKKRLKEAAAQEAKEAGKKQHRGYGHQSSSDSDSTKFSDDDGDDSDGGHSALTELSESDATLSTTESDSETEEERKQREWRQLVSRKTGKTFDKGGGRKTRGKRRYSSEEEEEEDRKRAQRGRARHGRRAEKKDDGPDFSNPGFDKHGKPLSKKAKERQQREWAELQRKMKADQAAAEAERQRLLNLPEDKAWRMSQLRHLALNACRIERLPKFFGGFPNLINLDLSGNKLLRLPPAVCHLTKLRCLYVAKNKLTKLPRALGSLSSLTGLYADDNAIEKLPRFMVTMTSLRVLVLNGNSLSKLPKHIDKLTRLQVLKICNQTNLTKLPHRLANMTQLQELHLSPPALTEVLTRGQRLLLDTVPIFELK